MNVLVAGMLLSYPWVQGTVTLEQAEHCVHTSSQEEPHDWWRQQQHFERCIHLNSTKQ